MTRPPRRLVGIVGPPGVGKSTLAAKLAAADPDGTAAVLPMDGFHLPSARLVELGRRDRMGAAAELDEAGRREVEAVHREHGRGAVRIGGGQPGRQRRLADTGRADNADQPPRRASHASAAAMPSARCW